MFFKLLTENSSKFDIPISHEFHKLKNVFEKKLKIDNKNNCTNNLKQNPTG